MLSAARRWEVASSCTTKSPAFGSTPRSFARQSSMSRRRWKSTEPSLPWFTISRRPPVAASRCHSFVKAEVHSTAEGCQVTKILYLVCQ